ncbi:MAG: hypothetical protein ACRELY_11680 [Polyangiaceae bacterium]
MRSACSAIALALFVVSCGGEVTSGEKPNDAGTQTDTSTDTFDVASLPGLVLWLDASQGVMMDGAGVHAMTWADQSSEHDDLKLIRGLGATLDGAPLGSSPTLRFDGATAYQIAASPLLADWSGDFLIEIALHVDISNPQNQGFFSCFGDPPPPPGFTLVDSYITKGQTAACDISGGGFTDSASTHPVVNIGGYLVGFRRVGSQYEARRNGNVDATVTVTHVTMPKCTTSYFGALSNDATTTLNGFSSSEIAEVIVVKNTVSDDVVEKLETSLRDKFDLPDF